MPPPGGRRGGSRPGPQNWGSQDLTEERVEMEPGPGPPRGSLVWRCRLEPGPSPRGGSKCSLLPALHWGLPCPSGSAHPPPRHSRHWTGSPSDPPCLSLAGPSSSPVLFNAFGSATSRAGSARDADVEARPCVSGPPVLSLPPAPAMAPQNVRVTPLTASQLEVTWDPPPPESQNGNVQGYKASSAPRGRPTGHYGPERPIPRWSPGPHTLPLSAHCSLALVADTATIGSQSHGRPERQGRAGPALPLAGL